jgi:1,4-dihydroxy-2-naphthoyl-CoA synthase
LGFRDLLYSLEERVASIRFNRPNSPNALTTGMLGEISDANNSQTWLGLQTNPMNVTRDRRGR